MAANKNRFATKNYYVRESAKLAYRFDALQAKADSAKTLSRFFIGEN
jgi:hypothetical protein